MASRRICPMIFPGKKWDWPMCSSPGHPSCLFLKMGAVFVFIQLLETFPDLRNFWNMRELPRSVTRQSLSIFLQIPSGSPGPSISWDFLRDPWLNPLPVLVVSLLLELCRYKRPQDLAGKVRALSASTVSKSPHLFSGWHTFSLFILLLLMWW